jgi:hypothetical protein
LLKRGMTSSSCVANIRAEEFHIISDLPQQKMQTIHFTSLHFTSQCSKMPYELSDRKCITFTCRSFNIMSAFNIYASENISLYNIALHDKVCHVIWFTLCLHQTQPASSIVQYLAHISQQELYDIIQACQMWTEIIVSNI